MKTIGIIICLVLVCLILAVVYDFIASRARNREKFGSDFLFDTIDKGSNASNSKSLNEQNINEPTFSEAPVLRKIATLKKDDTYNL